MFPRIQSIDNKVLDRMGDLHRPALNRIMITISRLGNGGIIWWIVCLPFLCHPSTRAIGVAIILAVGIASGMGEGIIKHTVKRVRPCHKLDDDEQLINKPKYYSFPSGHTTASFSVVGVALICCPPAVIIPIFVLASLIGFSRIYLRVHYLTDVVVGVFLGILCGAMAVLLVNSVVPGLTI